MKEFKLQQFPAGRWGIIMLTARGDVDTALVDGLDEALDWIRERAGQR